MIDIDRIKLIVIGASMGGLKAHESILPNLPKKFKIPILIANHITPGFDKSWISSINKKSQINIQWAEHFQFIRPGNCYFAPPDFHLTLSGRTRVTLNQEKPFRKCRPAINHLFASASEFYGKHTLGILLTGLNEDGASGLTAINDKGGQFLIQDPKTADGKNMPQMAIDLLKPENTFSIDEITELLKIISDVKATD